MVKVAIDLPDVEKYWENAIKAQSEYMAAVQKQIASEPGHLEALLIFEKNTDGEDAEDIEPKSEEELSSVMKAHKDASPFAMDVAAARAKLLEVMQE